MSQITKRALIDAFYELLEDKPMSKITISDITNRAGVNRHTFYYHFRDINDMIAWNFSSKIEELVKENGSYKNWAEGYRKILDYSVTNKKKVLAIYHSSSKDHLLRFFSEWLRLMVRKVLDEESVGMYVLDKDKEFLADFYKHGFMGLFTDWLDGGMMEDPDYMVRQSVILLHGEFKESLQRFENATYSRH